MCGYKWLWPPQSEVCTGRNSLARPGPITFRPGPFSVIDFPARPVWYPARPIFRLEKYRPNNTVFFPLFKIFPLLLQLLLTAEYFRYRFHSVIASISVTTVSVNGIDLFPLTNIFVTVNGNVAVSISVNVTVTINGYLFPFPFCFRYCKYFRYYNR